MKASIHRPTVAKVKVGNIGHNFDRLTENLPARTKKFAVVKAGAYGHGAVEVARELSSKADGFCVSNMDEALELRQAGLEHPILILGVVPTDCIPLARQTNISLTVSSLDWWHLVQEAGLELDGLSVHIKVDTGMGRLGFRNVEEITELIEELAAADVDFEGIFTHFAAADQADDCYYQEQLQNFRSILDQLTSLPDLIHASNSAASIWHPDAVFNMIRLGDALYGLNPSGRELELPYALLPALSLESQLVQTKLLDAGQKIGYGMTYESRGDEYIGTVPIGYADGLLRAMQGFSVLVDGEPCPIVGRVSMDQITIRLPKPYPLGTKVTLIGQDGDREITVQDWADYVGTINYEVVCLLSSRIYRQYIE